MGIYFGNLMINNGGNVTTTDSLPYLTKATLTTYNWVNNQQTVTIEGIVSDETQQVIEITPVFNENIMDKIASYNIYASSQENNTITFSCDSVPTIDVEFYVKWQDVIWIPNEITFTINGNSYTAERGMNWEQWCNSEYNTEGWTIQSMASGSYLYMVVKNSNGVGIDSTNEKIVENKAYITSSVIQEPV